MATICRNCKANKTVRCGIRRTKERGQVQRFRCNACHKTFSEDKGFLGRHKSEETIFQTIEFYNKGLSFRQLAESFQISKNTALEWIFHFARLVLRHLWQLKPKYARHLHLDELFLKMNGTFHYLWSSMDRETKWATNHFSQRRTRQEAQSPIQKSPQVLVDATTDGAFGYISPFNAEYGPAWVHEHYHRAEYFEDKKHNNPIERLNNTWRRHLHPRKGFDGLASGILQIGLLTIYYNFIRRHMTLGRTPAEAAGVWSWPPKMSERQKWQRLIEKVVSLLINRILGQSRLFGAPIRAAPGAGFLPCPPAPHRFRRWGGPRRPGPWRCPSARGAAGPGA